MSFAIRAPRVLMVAFLAAATVFSVGGLLNPQQADAATSQRAKIVNIAMSYVGVAQYRFGAEGTQYVDCSGLVWRVYKQAGLEKKIGGARMGARSYYYWFKRRGLASRIPAEIRDYGADLGVVTYQPADDDLESVVVYHDQLAFVVPRSHRFVKRRQVSIKDLGGERFVAHHVASPYRARVVETFRKRRVTLQMPVEMPTIDAIKKFVAEGHGVALLPAIAVQGELDRGDLVRVRVPELAFERPVRLIYRKGATMSQAAEAFLSVAESQATRRRGRYAFTREQ